MEGRECREAQGPRSRRGDCPGGGSVDGEGRILARRNGEFSPVTKHSHSGPETTQLSGAAGKI